MNQAALWIVTAPLLAAAVGPAEYERVGLPEAPCPDDDLETRLKCLAASCVSPTKLFVGWNRDSRPWGTWAGLEYTLHQWWYPKAVGTVVLINETPTMQYFLFASGFTEESAYCENTPP